MHKFARITLAVELNLCYPGMPLNINIKIGQDLTKLLSRNENVTNEQLDKTIAIYPFLWGIINNQIIPAATTTD